MLGLVLTAGGARGAYQAGVLKRMGEIPAFRSRPSPFAIVAGASAGAINGTTIAALSGNFHDATQMLARLWGRLTVSDVFRPDLLSIGMNGARLLVDMALGGMIGGGRVNALLDASPLRRFLEASLPFEGIADGIKKGHLYAIAITATSYHSGKSFIFIQGRDGHPLWMKSRRVTMPVTLTVDHVCASASIPIVFSPVLLRSNLGNVFLGDGGLRLTTPFSPAIRLGATRVFGIGIRSQRAADALSRAEQFAGESDGAGLGIVRPPLSQICGVFLNAIFLDHLDTDLDHLQRMNELIDSHGPTPLGVKEPMRRVIPMIVHPSEDLAMVAKRLAHRMPRVVRYMMDGLGTPNAESADLMSYLLFDSMYTRTLIDIGYRDASARIDEIEAFLRNGDAACALAS